MKSKLMARAMRQIRLFRFMVLTREVDWICARIVSAAGAAGELRTLAGAAQGNSRRLKLTTAGVLD